MTTTILNNNSRFYLMYKPKNDAVISPDLIRHTTATNALERGMDVTELQKILGHAKLDTTMIYAKVCQENVKHNHKQCII